ncbi:MAG: hypothetical protein JST93_11350 [Acidobacteria bacterium]|nr:hypothetical protein [Acidobacteriota bacterium]
MKRFQFHLQTALDWRKRQMETEQARLDELLLREGQLQQALEDTARDRARSEADLLRVKSLEAADLAALDGYLRALDHQKRRLHTAIAETQQAITRQRQLLMTAMRDYRLIEKLKQRRLGEWQQQFERELEAEATELFLSKRARSQSS